MCGNLTQEASKYQEGFFFSTHQLRIWKNRRICHWPRSLKDIKNGPQKVGHAYLNGMHRIASRSKGFVFSGNYWIHRIERTASYRISVLTISVSLVVLKYMEHFSYFLFSCHIYTPICFPLNLNLVALQSKIIILNFCSRRMRT